VEVDVGLVGAGEQPCMMEVAGTGVVRRRRSDEGSGQWVGIDLTRNLQVGGAKDGVAEGSGGGYDEDLVIDVY